MRSTTTMLELMTAAETVVDFGPEATIDERYLRLLCEDLFVDMRRHEVIVALSDGTLRWGVRTLEQLFALLRGKACIVRVARLASADINKIVPSLG